MDPAPPFNANGDRTVKVWVEGGGYLNIGQRLTYVSPYQIRIFSTTHMWCDNFLTTEFEPNEMVSLLKNFPQYREAKDPIEKRFRLYRFMSEAGQFATDWRWFDLANKELDSIEKDLPAAKEQVLKARTQLRNLEIDHYVELIKRQLSAGQLNAARESVAKIPTTGIDPLIQVRVNPIRNNVESFGKRFDSAQHFLRVLPDDAEGKCAEFLCDAAAVIRAELYPEALDRLEPFVELAEQAERVKKQGGTPSDSAEQLLARAVSGWLLGKESSDSRPEVARKLWKARAMAEEYIRTPDLRDRNALRQRYEKDEPVEFGELARIIALLPPPSPDPNASSVMAELETIRRKTNLPGSNRLSADYEVMLPPEYRPGRPYPVLVVLHQDGETLKKTLERYGYYSRLYGYVLVAAEWGTGFGGAYRYSDDEHQRVLDVIRDMRFHFHVDSDRIFLSGFGEGGNAAWDIGLSHPDLFAAVIPIASDPNPSFILKYWPNAIHLPFYLINGEFSGNSAKAVRKVMEFWINKGFPCLNVVYQGRGMGWFSGEMPYAFDWINRRKRMDPFPELGRWPAVSMETSMQTARPYDSHFYWLAADEITESHRMDLKGANVSPAQIQGIIRPGNKIEVFTFGLKKVTIGLTPSMIDYTKPVAIKLTGEREIENLYWPNGKKALMPDLGTMMEDFLQRGDNTHLFSNKITLNPQKPPKSPSR